MAGTGAAWPWRSVGAWMTALLVVLMLVNTVRAVRDPVAFAAYFGLPGAADADPGFVYVYASRALFLALATGALFAARQWRALGWFALCAMVMPLSDGALAESADAPLAIVARHVGIGAYLAVTAVLLFRLDKART